MYDKEYITENILKYYKYIRNDYNDTEIKHYKLTSGINFGILEENNYSNYPSIVINLFLKPSQNLYDLSHFIRPWNKEYDIDWCQNADADAETNNNEYWVNRSIYNLVHNNNCKNNFINIILDRLNSRGINNVKLNIVGYSYGGCLGLYLAMYLTQKNIIHSSFIKCIIIDAPQFCSQKLLDKYNNYYFISGSIIPYIFSIMGYGKYKIDYKVTRVSINIIYNHLKTIENWINEHRSDYNIDP